MKNVFRTLEEDEVLGQNPQMLKENMQTSPSGDLNHLAVRPELTSTPCAP